MAPANFSNLSFLPLNLPKLYKRNMVSLPNSSYLLYDSIKLVQFFICNNFGPLIHKILVLPLLMHKVVEGSDECEVGYEQSYSKIKWPFIREIMEKLGLIINK